MERYSPALRRHAGLDPPAEESDPLRRPGAIAWHRTAFEPLQDVVRVAAHILVVPQVEGEIHRVAIHLSEQRLDVVFEAGRLRRACHRPTFSLGTRRLTPPARCLTSRAQPRSR